MTYPEGKAIFVGSCPDDRARSGVGPPRPPPLEVPRFLTVVLASIGLTMPALFLPLPDPSAADPDPCSIISGG